MQFYFFFCHQVSLIFLLSLCATLLDTTTHITIFNKNAKVCAKNLQSSIYYTTMSRNNRLLMMLSVKSTTSNLPHNNYFSILFLSYQIDFKLVPLFVFSNVNVRRKLYIIYLELLYDTTNYCNIIEYKVI